MWHICQCCVKRPLYDMCKETTVTGFDVCVCVCVCVNRWTDDRERARILQGTAECVRQNRQAGRHEQGADGGASQDLLRHTEDEEEAEPVSVVSSVAAASLQEGRRVRWRVRQGAPCGRRSVTNGQSGQHGRRRIVGLGNGRRPSGVDTRGQQ